LKWIGGVLGISERCEKRYGVDPIVLKDKKRNGYKNWQQKNGSKKMATINSTQKETNTIE